MHTSARASDSPQNSIILVACVSMKLDHPAPAKDLYVSPWFKMARAYAERHGSAWFILSDKHGLIDPNQIVAPYDVSMRDMSVAQRREWGKRVLSQLDAKHLNSGRVVILAGKTYRAQLDDGLRARFKLIDVPMEGLGIGRQLQWLKRETRQ